MSEKDIENLEIDDDKQEEAFGDEDQEDVANSDENLNDKKKKSHLSKKKQLEYFKKRRKIHHAKIVISRARVFARMFSVILLVLLTIGLVRTEQWYLPKKIFNTYPSKHLAFEGNNITPNIKILNAIRKIKLPHKPVYLIDTKIFEKELLKLSPVKRVYVKRFGFPASLKIVLEERTPVLSIAPQQNAATVAVFTEDGTAIGRDFLPLSKKIQTYKILTYEDYFQWTKKEVEYLAFLAKTAEIYSKEEVQYVDLRNPDDVRIQIKSVNIRLGQLDKTVFNRLRRISAILPQAINSNEKIVYIDLRWKNTAYFKLQK